MFDGLVVVLLTGVLSLFVVSLDGSVGRTVTLLGLSEVVLLGFLSGKAFELVLPPVSLPLELDDELLPLLLGRVDVDGRLFDSVAAEDPGRLLFSGRVDVDGRLLDGRSLEGLLGLGRLLLLLFGRLLFGLLLLLFGRLFGLWLLL